jgi:hypothetical protein
MPKLLNLVAAHEQFMHATLLKKNFGDGYLYVHNPVFAGVRDLFLKYKFFFRSEKKPRYQKVFPLMELHDMLESKEVPFLDNYTPLKKIELRRSGVFDFDEISMFELNYLLHESSHCIAHAVLSKRIPEKPNVALKKVTFLKLLLGESFAMTMEVLGGCYVQSEIEDILYRCNTYTYITPNSFSKIKLALNVYGVRRMTSLLLLSYFYSNLLFTSVSKSEFNKRVLKFCDFSALTKKESQLLKDIFDYGFLIQKDFKLKTSYFYTKYRGLKGDFFECVDVDPISLLSKAPFSKGFKELLDDVETFQYNNQKEAKAG